MNKIAIPLASITADPRVQSRAGRNEETVSEYAQAMRDGAVFPPIIVFQEGETFWLSEGFHRVGAAEAAGFSEIEADVRPGTRRDAILHSLGANSDHGLRRTNADKRHAVTIMLEDEEWSGWSDREIARACSVDHKTVGRIRSDVVTGEIPSERAPHEDVRTYRDRHGNVAVMRTGAIGRKPEPAQVPSNVGYVRDGSDAGSEDAGVTAGETAPSNVVQIGARQPVLPSFEQLDRQNDAADDAADAIEEEIDLDTVEGRAKAVNGALSVLDITEISGREYWSVFCRDPSKSVYAGWVRSAHAKLCDLLKEIDNAELLEAQQARGRGKRPRATRS